MYKKFEKRFNKTMVVINPGEYYTSTDNEIISTVLGSCIAVCLYDEVNNIAGMNHFMLVGDLRDERIFMEPSARYGIFAMEVLINDIIKKGGKKENLKAKVFGGGHVLNYKTREGNVVDNNIRFAVTFLKLEKIPIVNQDVGGYQGRKILFFTDTYKVLVKKLRSTVSKEIQQEIKQEQAYVKRLQQEQTAHKDNERINFFE